MHQKEQTIIETLLKNENLSFRGLQRETKISPRILKKHITTLRKNGLVREEIDKSWKWKFNKVDNRPRIHSLTNKGLETGFQLGAIHIKQGLRILESISVGLDPSKVSESINAETKALEDKMTKDKQPFKGKRFGKKIEEYQRRLELLREPILEPLKSLLRIYIQLQSRDMDFDKIITIVEGNRNPITIPSRLLDGIDFRWVAFLIYFKNSQDLKIHWTPKPSKFIPQELLKKLSASGSNLESNPKIVTPT